MMNLKFPKLNIITNPVALHALHAYVKAKEYVAYDSETTGVLKGSEVIGYSICLDADDAYYVVLAKWNKEKQTLEYNADLFPYSKTILEELRNKQLIMHNAVFDCFMAETYFKVPLIRSVHTDTMILAHLLNENRKIGLKELGKEYFGQDAAKEEQELKDSVIANGGEYSKKKKELYKADWEILAKYGAKDAWLTYMLFLQMVPELYEQKLDKFFYEEESMPLLRGPTYELNTTGLTVDQNEIITLEKQLKAECLQDMDFIMTEIKPYIKDKYHGDKKTNTFNIGSNNQLSWLLFGQLEMEFGTLTKGGKEACKEMGLKLPYTKSAKREFIYQCLQREGEQLTPDAKVNGKIKKGKKVKAPWAYIAVDVTVLNKIASKHEWLKRYLGYKKKQKLLQTYIGGIKERLHYGIIYPSFLQTGTNGTRYSSKNPNFQNLPRGDERIKKCIIARPGKCFVSADQSQLEPRIFAFLSGDERLIGAFHDKTDFYSVAGIETFDKYDATPYKDGSPDAFGIKYAKLRDNTKTIVLAATYGSLAAKLMQSTGKSKEETQDIIDRYFEKFPKVKQMQLRQHTQVKKHGVVYNYFGRPRRLPEAKTIPKNLKHEELPYNQRKLLNSAVNAPIQSTGGSIINRASIRLYENLRLADIENCPIVLQVHDELWVECNIEDKDTVALLLQDAMENAVTLPGMPLEAIPRITSTLAKKSA